jgi:pimeloyl-ACP methyl ester carboxylesterase
MNPAARLAAQAAAGEIIVGSNLDPRFVHRFCPALVLAACALALFTPVGGTTGLAIVVAASVVAQMRNAPFRPALEKMAHTLVYESMILRSLPAELIAYVRAPTLLIDGENSPEVVRHTAQTLAEALPDGRYRTLKGQGHDTAPAVVGPVLEEFFLAQRRGEL